MEELLVIFACLNSSGCQETTRHYYNTHIEARTMIKKSEVTVTRLVGPVTVEILGPLAMAIAGNTGTIRLSTHFSLQGSKDRGILEFGVEF